MHWASSHMSASIWRGPSAASAAGWWCWDSGLPFLTGRLEFGRPVVLIRPASPTKSLAPAACPSRSSGLPALGRRGGKRARLRRSGP